MTEFNAAFSDCNKLSGHPHDMSCYCGAHPHAMPRTQGHVEKRVDPRFYNAQYHIDDMPVFNDPRYNQVCGPQNGKAGQRKMGSCPYKR